MLLGGGYGLYLKQLHQAKSGKRIIDEVHAATTRWRTFAAKAKVSPTTTRQITKSLPKLT